MPELDTTNGAKHFGKFEIGGDILAGELTFNRADTNLHLHHSEFFRPDQNPHQCIHGVLRSLEKVSLLRCNAPPVPGTYISAGESYSFADIFPHFITYGGWYLSPIEPSIKGLHLVTDDLKSIFRDFDTFNFSLNPEKFIKQIIADQQREVKRNISVGPDAEVAYFSGKRTIFSVQTPWGKISATNNPRRNWGGLEGVFIKNVISVDIEFAKAVNFDHALQKLTPVLRFLELIAGRRQNLTSLSLTLTRKGKSWRHLNTYWSMPPTRLPELRDEAPQSGDIPIYAAREPTYFGTVLTAWLNKDIEWGDARERFSESFSRGNLYDIDRIVSSANMFDLLGPPAVPKTNTLSKELSDAQANARTIFKRLPLGAEREGVLRALARMGHASLRQKINHRAEILLGEAREMFPDLKWVVEIAVDCRNHYVHGTAGKVDYRRWFFETVPFLTDTLEFIFAASDLIECGWDINGWRKQGTTMSHPFGRYAVNYPGGLAELKAIAPTKEA